MPDPRRTPLGPEVSWPTGYPAMGYGDGDYRYPAPPQADRRSQAGPLSADPGLHPYAAFEGDGYGDDGYRDPGYQGPSAQDAGIAGTRTVRGFVEQGRDASGYRLPAGPSGYNNEGGYGQSNYERDDYGYTGSSYAVGEIELAYPPAAASSEVHHGADLYQQPWDYAQPLRYEGEADTYPGAGELYAAPMFDTPSYNGSEYSVPGVDGPGYDLAGIIGTSDFEQIGYDEPSLGRLSYDDPRYDSGSRYGAGSQHDGGGRRPEAGPRFDETRFDVPRFDETRLDNLWVPDKHARPDAGPAGYGSGGFAGSFTRSGFSSDDTRLDMRALGLDRTRYDTPVLDETRFDMRAQAGGVLAPPKPRNWAEETSLDFDALDLTDEPVPAAFTRTLDRPAEREQGDVLDTGARRAGGRRRGRSSDRKHWMALGAIAVVAAGAIGGVLVKYVFAGPNGPAHQIVAPRSVDGYQRSAALEKQLHVTSEAQGVVGTSAGHATDPVGAVYARGALTPGANTRMFMFVGGKLSGADPAASIAEFEQHYPGARTVPSGSFGGETACTTSTLEGQSAAMCVWFDNDTFGTVVSPSMTTADLATTMQTVRPSLEQTIR